MNILVLIKQVPAGSTCLDNDGILDRSKSGTTINPYDLYALETAYQFKKKLNEQGKSVSITSLSMGPESAAEIIRTSYSYGCDNGYLLSDKVFGGADVYLTAYTIKQGIDILGNFDLIITGQQTTDGDTAQVPYSLGSQLNIRTIGWVKNIIDIDNDKIKVEQELSSSNQIIEVSYPVLISVGEYVFKPHIPSLRDQLMSKKKEVKVITLNDLNDRNKNHYGLNGSPTRVVNIKRVKRDRMNAPITFNDFTQFKQFIDDNLVNIEGAKK